MPEVDYDKLAGSLGGQAEGSDPYDSLASQFGGISSIELPGKKSRSQLQSEHAQNVSAEQEAYKPGWAESYQHGGLANVWKESARDVGDAVLETPRRLLRSAVNAPRMLYDAATRPAEFGVKAVESTTEPLISPRTAGKASVESGIDTAAMMGAGEVVPALSRFKGRSDVARFTKGRNQLITAITDGNPTKRTVKAFDEGYHLIDDYMQRTKSKFKDLPSFASTAEAAEQAFAKQHYEPISKMLKDVPEFGALESRRAAINLKLEKMGYYDKNPTAQALARSNPTVQALVEEGNGVRLRANEIVDQMAPVSGGAQNMMKQWSDIKHIAQKAREAADNHAMGKIAESAQVSSGGKMANLAEGAAAVTSLASGQPGIPLATRAIRMGMRGKTTKTIPPDMLVRRAANNLTKRGLIGDARNAINRPSPITPVPIELPGAIPAKPPVSRVEARNAKADRIRTLRDEGLTPDQIQERLRTESLPAEGQEHLPFVPPEVGGIPQEAGGFKPTPPPVPYRTLGDVELENRLKEAVFNDFIPQQKMKALPPKRSGPITPSQASDVIIDAKGNVHPAPIELPDIHGRPNRRLLPENVPTTGQIPFENYGPDAPPQSPVSRAQQRRQRTPPTREDELINNFGGTIRTRSTATPATSTSSGPSFTSNPEYQAFVEHFQKNSPPKASLGGVRSEIAPGIYRTDYPGMDPVHDVIVWDRGQGKWTNATNSPELRESIPEFGRRIRSNLGGPFED